MTHKHFRRIVRGVIASTLAGTAACTDAEPPTAVAATPGLAQAERMEEGGIIREMPVLPAFDMDLSASGSMQPGKPIEVHLRVRANLPVADAEVMIATPDMDRPQVSTWDDRFGSPVGKRVAKRVGRRGGWQKGQSSSERLRLTVPAPGYYRVIASVFSHSVLPATVDDSLRVVGDVHREIWLRVDRRGGRYTAQFDTTVFPAEAERRAGPLHCTVDLDEERLGRKRDAGCDGALITAFDSKGITTLAPEGAVSAALLPGDMVCPMSMGSCDPCAFDPASCYGEFEPLPPPPPPADPCFAGTHVCIQFTYLTQSGGSSRPAPEGTLVEASYQDRDCALVCWWEEERSTFYRTDNQGRVIIPCPSSSTEKRLRTAYEFLDEFVAVSRSEWNGPTVQGACPMGWKNVDMVANQEAFVFGNMRKSGQRAKQLFWWSSERTRVDFDNGDVHWPTSGYNAPMNVISLLGVDIWGNEGAATQAHEYGHSYHHKALGGIGHIYVSGNPLHDFEASTNGAQALLEGFADFFETLVMPDRGRIHEYVRNPEGHLPALPVGPRAEARVAAFLWDYIDDANEKGSFGEYLPTTDPNYWGTVPYLPAEPFDAVQFPHTDLAHVLIWCRTGVFATRPESIEGLMECFRARTDATGQANLNRLYARTVNGII